MKKIIAVFTLLFLLTGTVGIQLIFTGLQKNVRWETHKRLKRGVPERELHAFTFSDEVQPRWVKPGRELRVGNEMFDVVRKTESDGKVTYYCIGDHQESHLFANLGQLTKKNLCDDDSPTGISLRLAFKLTYFSEIKPVRLNTFVDRTVNIDFFQYSGVPLKGMLETATPPPDHFNA